MFGYGYEAGQYLEMDTRLISTCIWIRGWAVFRDRYEAGQYCNIGA